MNATASAFVYLFRTTARNRIRRQAARLKQPRYALAFALGLLYFWFFFVRRTASSPMSDRGAFVMMGIFGVFILGYLAWAWVMGTDRTALAFTQAEVAMLFPAPLSRRGLILFKLARAQFAILFSVLLWSVILNRAGTPLASVFRGIGLWTALTTISLHRLGIGLLRAGVEEHGLAGARRSWPAMAVFAACVGLVGWTAHSHWDWVTNAPPEPRGMVEVFSAIFDLPPASWVLYPIKVAYLPIVTREPLAFASALAQALGLLAIHLLWVLSSDKAFEEAAADASDRQAKWAQQMRARRGGGAVVRKTAVRRTIPLAPRGMPAVAIIWKNLLWLLRTHQLRGILLPPVLLLAATLAFGRREGMGIVLGGMSASFSLLFLMFGPGTMRNDLRSDLLHLPMLKTLPIPPRALVSAQVMSGAITMWVPQLLLLGVAAVGLLLEPGTVVVPPDVFLAVLVGAPFVLLALNVANFAVHNGVALLFPAWVKLGERGAGGIEATGQMMMTTLATLLALLLLLVVPALAGAIGFFLFASDRGTGILVASLAGAAGLGVEAWLMTSALGRAFAKVEPAQVGG